MNLLEQIFDWAPAELGNNYIESILSDVRYIITNDESFESAQVNEPNFCPDWLTKDDHLGPYEKSLLLQILSSKNVINPFRGGSGSGKSSLVSAIYKRCGQLCEEADWPSKYGLNSFMALITFQSATEYSVDNKIEAKEMSSVEDRFWRDISTDLISHICTKLIRINESSRIFTRIDPNNTTPTILKFYDYLDSSKTPINRMDGPSLYRFIDKFTAEISNSNEDRFEVCIHIFHYIAEKIKEIDKSYNFILLFDDTDRVNTKILEKFYNYLNAISNRLIGANSALKIVTFMRLSTVHDTIAALNHTNFGAIATPDPYAVLIARILGFLLSDEIYIFNDNKDITDAKYGLVELLIRLVDPNDRLFELLISVSGSNLRSLMIQSKKIVSSESFVSRINSQEKFEESLNSILFRYAEDLLINILEKNLLEFKNHVENYEKLDVKLVRVLAKKVEESWFNIVFSHAYNDYDAKTFRFTPRKRTENRLMRTYCAESDDISLLLGSSPLFFRLYSGIFVDLDATIKSKVSQKAKRLFIDKISTRILSLARMRVKSTPPLRDQFIMELYFALVKTLSKSLKTYTQLKRNKPKFVDTGGDMYRRGLSKSGANIYIFSPGKRHFSRPLISRYQASKILLNEGIVSPFGEFRPINVFSTGDNTFKPTALDILYVLGMQNVLRQEGQNGLNLTVVTIHNYLQQLGYSDVEIVTAFQQLTSVDNRLIYSTVADFDQIEKNSDLYKIWNNSVYLSLTGSRYFGLLFGNLTYIQWALSKVSKSLDLSIERTENGPEGGIDLLPLQFSDRYDLASGGLLRSLQDTSLVLVEAARRRINSAQELFWDDLGISSQKVWLRHKYPEVDIFFRISENLSQLVMYQSGISIHSTRDTDRIVELAKFISSSASEIIIELNEKNSGEQFTSWESQYSEIQHRFSPLAI